MAYSIRLYFDPLTQEMVEAFWGSMQSSALPKDLFVNAELKPSLCLMYFSELDIEKAKKALEEFAPCLNGLEIRLEATGIALTEPSALSWIVTPTSELLQFHQSLHDRLTSLGRFKLENKFKPGNWIPQVSLILNMTDRQILPSIVKATLVLPEQRLGNAASLGIQLFNPPEIVYEVPVKA